MKIGQIEFGNYVRIYEPTFWLLIITFILVTILVICPTIINLFIWFSSHGLKTSMDQRDLFNKLRDRTKYDDVKLIYGEVKRHNNHFNYKAAYKTLYMPLRYENKNNGRVSMVMLYNFSNILDIREQKTNFWSRSIWCHISAGYGILIFMVALGLTLGFNLESYNKAFKVSFNTLVDALCVLSLFFLIVGWTWWLVVSNKLIVHIKGLAMQVYEDKAEAKKIMFMFKLQSIFPFTINTTIPIPRKKTASSSAKTINNDPEELQSINV